MTGIGHHRIEGSKETHIKHNPKRNSKEFSKSIGLYNRTDPVLLTDGMIQGETARSYFIGL